MASNFNYSGGTNKLSKKAESFINKLESAKINTKKSDGAYKRYESAKANTSAVDSAKKKLDGIDKTKPGQFTYGQQAMLDNIYNDIINRKDFEFDLDGSSLWKQYKEQYANAGKRAMEDVTAQASAQTGGYASSFATGAGMNAYNEQLQKLQDLVPSLYSLAQGQYQLQGENLQSKYSALQNDRDFQYGTYRDKVNDWQDDRNYYAGRYDSERSNYYSNLAQAFDEYATLSDQEISKYGQAISKYGELASLYQTLANSSGSKDLDLYLSRLK